MSDVSTKQSGGPGRNLPVGAEWLSDASGVDFRVWAPKRKQVEIVFEDGSPSVVLRADGEGYYRGFAPAATVGCRYRIRLDDDETLYPDPASRAQPLGPHGPSEVVDAAGFPWRDANWRGVSRAGQVLYELHIGTFTLEGTWASAIRELDELARLGVTIIEVMPIAEFPGRFGWGYDGVSLFAPTRLYGTPDDARRFVDTAHALGMGVILDVVYNHFGPDGNYLAQFSDTYFTTKHATDWGAAINYDDAGSRGPRELVLANVRYWVSEFHFDGLRLDATQNIYDESDSHILREICDVAREAASGRGIFIAGENEAQEAMIARPPERGGYGLDALWNDDFHHSAHVALTGRAEAYYTDYGGTPQELISAMKWGYLYQGQHYAWQKQRRGRPALDLAPSSFISFLENHDQVANSLRGERLHRRTSPARHRALVALLLLGPSTPLLFQGEEFASSSPFLFFADHGHDLALLVREGRRSFLAQFPSMNLPDTGGRLDRPDDLRTFERCKLDVRERETHAATYSLYRDLIALRRSDKVFSGPRARGMDGAVLSSHAFVLRFFAPSPCDDRIVLCNLGRDEVLARAPEPLLAPPEGRTWETLWSSERPEYGGDGCAPLERAGVWHIHAECSVVLCARSETP